MLYPQNGDRIVTVDFVTLFHPVYKLESVRAHRFQLTQLLAPILLAVLALSVQLQPQLFGTPALSPFM